MSMRGPIASFVLFSIILLSFTCRGGESGEVLVVGFANGVPITQVGTNDYYRDKLMRGLEKKTVGVELERPKEWRKIYDQFSSALVKDAKLAGLQADSLETLLKKLPRARENRGLAVIPVAVHQTHNGEEPIWIITLKWEVKGSNSLAHIRRFWFSRSSLKQLAFWTCA